VFLGGVRGSPLLLLLLVALLDTMIDVIDYLLMVACRVVFIVYMLIVLKLYDAVQSIIMHLDSFLFLSFYCSFKNVEAIINQNSPKIWTTDSIYSI